MFKMFNNLSEKKQENVVIIFGIICCIVGYMFVYSNNINDDMMIVENYTEVGTVTSVIHPYHFALLDKISNDEFLTISEEREIITNVEYNDTMNILHMLTKGKNELDVFLIRGYVNEMYLDLPQGDRKWND